MPGGSKLSRLLLLPLLSPLLLLLLLLSCCTRNRATSRPPCARAREIGQEKRMGWLR